METEREREERWRERDGERDAENGEGQVIEREGKQNVSVLPQT